MQVYKPIIRGVFDDLLQREGAERGAGVDARTGQLVAIELQEVKATARKRAGKPSQKSCA